jgi:lipopolysaccharide transport system ATP-binding protein
MSGELRVRNLGKAYRQWGGELRRIASWFTSAVKAREEHWVLQNVTFDLQPGQAVGVIGQNGAGKSTLLKLITGTVQPTCGEVSLQGRVSAILELGMGFTPDMTGRQNAIHSAGLLGYSRAEIDRMMPEIESFAEVGEYFDQPVRTYSSGMQMRVAFSVATAFKPDLLIVDEALSVGDSYFQHKSFDRIRQFKAQGVSIMFVSHSPSDIRTLCDRVILLDKGKVIKDGEPDEVVDYYNALVAQKENSQVSVEQRRASNGWLLTKSGTGEARVSSLQLLDSETGNEIVVARTDQSVRLRLVANVVSEIEKLVLGYMIRDKQGHVVWGTNTWHTHQIQEQVQAGEQVVFDMEFVCRLGPGSYSVSPALVSCDTHLSDNYEWVDNLLVFDVINLDQAFFIGTTALDGRFEVSRSMLEVGVQ